MAEATSTRTLDSHRAEPMSDLRAMAEAGKNHPLFNLVTVAMTTGFLLVIGTMMVWSASTVFAYKRFGGDALYFLRRQVVFLVLGLIALGVLLKISIARLRAMGWLLFLLAGALIALTFTPLGYNVNGNSNWINLGSGSLMIRLQPSELAKLAIIAWGATLMANKEKLIDQPKHLLVPFLPGSLMIIALVLLQHDLGTAMILGAIVLLMLWFVGANWRVLGTMVLGVAGGVALLVMQNPGRVARIMGFLNPGSDPTGINHQPTQAIYGLATGGWWGVGLGRSRMKWGSLVEAHTDFVLAVIGEELGLFGTIAVLFLLFMLGYAGFRIAFSASSLYAKLLASGITAWFMLQAIINIMVVLRLAPVLGVPLPFVSYGGSSLLANLMGVGVLIRCALEEPRAAAWIKAHRKTKGPRRRLTAVLTGRGRATS